MGSIIDNLLLMLFRVHDVIFSFVAKNARPLKTVMLIIAHASLIGFLFPEFRRDFGEMAGNLLIFILFLSPLATITGMPLLRLAMGFRREAGILMAYLAIVHGAGYFLDPAFSDAFLRPYLGTDLLSMDPRLLFGILGIVLTLPLLLTSNALALRVLGGRNWKRLHRLAYPLFVAVAVHRFLGETAVIVGLLQAALLIGGYGLLKYMAWKKESFLLFRKPMGIIGERYDKSKIQISNFKSNPNE
jgi:DMSO/TMAO reductase YedYZ heme-binding membrane subunit